jgi:hypothetical protein
MICGILRATFKVMAASTLIIPFINDSLTAYGGDYGNLEDGEIVW